MPEAADLLASAAKRRKLDAGGFDRMEQEVGQKLNTLKFDTPVAQQSPASSCGVLGCLFGSIVCQSWVRSTRDSLFAECGLNQR